MSDYDGWYAKHWQQFGQPGMAEHWWRENGQVYSSSVAYEQFYQQNWDLANAIAGIPVQDALPREAPSIDYGCSGTIAHASLATPRPQLEAPSIEERRKALKAGDVIADPALLCKGMRIRYVNSGFDLSGTATGENDGVYKCGVDWDSHPSNGIMHEHIENRRVTFIDWASEGEEVKPTAITLPTAQTTNEVSYTGYARAMRKPTPPPSDLPFKRHPMCSVAHAAIVGERNCLGCERLIAEEMARADAAEAVMVMGERLRTARPEPHTLAPSGMCGPVLSRLR